jgi:hypothetical protein
MHRLHSVPRWAAPAWAVQHAARHSYRCIVALLVSLHSCRLLHGGKFRLEQRELGV